MPPGSQQTLVNGPSLQDEMMQRCPACFASQQLISRYYEQRRCHKLASFTTKSWTNHSLWRIVWKIWLIQHVLLFSLCDVSVRVWILCQWIKHFQTSFFQLLCSRAPVQSLEANGGYIPGFVCESYCRPPRSRVAVLITPQCDTGANGWVAAGGGRVGGGGWGGRGGGHVNEMLTDPAAITNHQSNLISWLTEWVCGFGTHPADAPGSEPCTT